MNRPTSPIYTASMQLALQRLDSLKLPEIVLRTINLAKFGQENETFYQNYPDLFAAAYVRLHPEQFSTIAAAGLLYYRSVIGLDTVLDSDGDSSSTQSNVQEKLSALAISVCQEETIKLLSSVFPLSSPFWDKWNLRRREYLAAYFQEKKVAALPRLTEEAYANVATNKSAFGRVAIDCLRELSGPDYEEVTQLLLQAHWEYSFGLQLLDDFQDFDEDGKNGQLNYFQSKLNEHITDHLQTPPTASQRKKLLYLSGVAETGLRLCAERFARADGLLTKICQPVGFTKVVKDSTAVVANLREQIRQYFAIVNVKTELYAYQRPEPYCMTEAGEGKPADRATARAINYILDQANRGFPELKHIMYLGAAEGFANDREVHVGDVFQRAILFDAVAAYAKARPGHVAVQQLLQDEAAYLKSQQLTEGVAGWSYYPTVREIAPDIDDLGQIMQCFHNVGDTKALEERCYPLLDFMCDHNFSTAAGAYETWLVPRSGRSTVERIRDQFNREKWGRGPDPEVVANMVYGAHLAGYSLPSAQLNSCYRYLITAQDDSGAWNSRWYAGPYYGTYVVSRALAAAGVGREALNKAHKYLKQRQGEDGSFEQSLLHTAIGSLALRACEGGRGLSRNGPSNQVDLALRYLIRQLNTCKVWPAPASFIIPKAGLPFGSTTLEAGYALKALYSA